MGRSRRLRMLLYSVILFGVFPSAWIARPVIVDSSVSVCFFRTFTGISCPFCGLTRAFAYATHGKFLKAQECHPLWWLAAVVIAAAGILCLAAAAKKK